jgi:hypothetical protein
MSEYYYETLIFFFGTWAITFLPQIKLYFPKRLPIAPSWALGVSFLCFCGIRSSKEDFQNSARDEEIALHEYCHQLQQRLLSPFGLAIIYFSEMVFRRIFINRTWMSAYENLYAEKQARHYMKTGKFVWKLKWE